jgi:SpoVK/Ycf46/Vps4 family AAA+-type ATPase
MADMNDDPVILALKAALESRDNLEVRCALGRHLMEKGEFVGALAEYEAAIKLAPSNQLALRGAIEAASKSGLLAKAEAYRMALGMVDAEPLAAQKSRLRLAAANGEILIEGNEAGITFKDVAGLESVKQSLTRSFLMPLRNPEIHEKFGKKVFGGLLLYGPPGCGKTYIARALAGEIGARFINISLIDVLDMWYGETEKKIHEIFESARCMAPSLVFFDEVDAIGHKRSQVRGAGHTTVNALLGEMDGFQGATEGVFFLAATNHPWDVDAALRRPGRFDSMVFVPPPDEPARLFLLEMRLRTRPLVQNIQLDRIVRRTDGFSGSDILALIERATELAIERSLDEGQTVPIDEDLLLIALNLVKPSTRPWLELSRNYALYANEGGTFDDLHAYLKVLELL